MSQNQANYADVMALKDLPAGRMKSCQLQGQDIVVCHTADGVFALTNLCTHAEARMSEGKLRGSRLICPLHGAAFDARNGCVLSAPASRPLTAHRARVQNGRIEVALEPTAGAPAESI